MTTASARRAAVLSLLLAVAWILLPLGLLRLPLWDWPIPNWPELIAYIGGFAIAFAAGGAAAVALSRLYVPGGQVEPNTPQAADRATKVVLVVTIVMNIMALLTRASFNPFTCGDILACSNAAYQGYVEDSMSGKGAFFEYVRIFLAPIIYAGVAMSVWSAVFGGEQGLGKYAAIVMASEVILAVATGTSRSIANILLFGFFLKFIHNNFAAKEKVSKWNQILFVSRVFILISMFLLYFSYLQLNRDGFVAAVGLLPFGNGFIESRSFQTGNDSFLLKGLESVVRYICTGYFSFSLALGLSAGQTFPYGASMFMALRTARGGDTSFVTHSLPGQIESHYDWSYLQQWHSLFSWLLSDYSPAGVASIMGIMGFLFTLSVFIAFSHRGGAMLKMPMFILFIVVLYVPANNQVFQSPEAAFSFFAAVFILLTAVAGSQWRQARSAHAAA